MNALLPTSCAVHRQRGYTLIEILVALLIALFLLGGLGTLVAGTSRTGSNQQLLAQLQDEERLAMSILNDTIELTGYYDTTTYSPPSITIPYSLPSGPFPATAVAGTALAAGQAISGTHTGIGTPDTLILRYSTTGADGILNCTGNTGGAGTFVNYFTIAQTSASPAQYALTCSPDGLTTDGVALVNGVVNMQVWYGVTTTAGTANVDTYLNATQVAASAGGWGSVTSARVTLTFNNPLYGQPGQAQYVYFTRLIALQGRAGSIMAQ
jgi:type IV pilus assembly protein PilW